MQDGTYPSRDFATLGPLGLRPPFIGIYIQTLVYNFILQHRADVRLYTSYFYLAKSYVFVKQSLPLFIYTIKFFFSRSYKDNLPSSFSIVIFYALAYSAN